PAYERPRCCDTASPCGAGIVLCRKLLLQRQSEPKGKSFNTVPPAARLLRLRWQEALRLHEPRKAQIVDIRRIVDLNRLARSQSGCRHSPCPQQNKRSS